jgi:hypothetical protein
VLNVIPRLATLMLDILAIFLIVMMIYNVQTKYTAVGKCFFTTTRIVLVIHAMYRSERNGKLFHVLLFHNSRGNDNYYLGYTTFRRLNLCGSLSLYHPFQLTLNVSFLDMCCSSCRCCHCHSNMPTCEWLCWVSVDRRRHFHKCLGM